MLKPQKNGLRARSPEVSCEQCPSGRRCWNDSLAAACDLRARREATLERGEPLFTQGEPFNGVLLIVSGCIYLSELAAEGTEHVVGFRVPGELVGLEGWVRGKHPHSATALEPTIVCRFNWSRDSRPRSSAALLQRILMKAGAQLERASPAWRGLPAAQRVAAFVQDFIRRAHGDVPARKAAALPMTRAQIGSYLGLAEETVVRALGRLKSSMNRTTDRTDQDASRSQRRHSAQ